MAAAAKKAKEALSADKKNSAEAKPGTKKKSKKLLIVILLLVLIAGGAGAGWYFFFRKAEKSGEKRIAIRTDMAYVSIPPEVLEFTASRIPEFYTGLEHFNDDILLIDNEIDRIKAYATSYPDQEKIVTAQVKVWEKDRKILTSALETLQGELETYFVSFSVNESDGLQRIESGQEKLKTLIDKTNEAVAERLQLLKDKTKPPEGWFESLKNRITGFFK